MDIQKIREDFPILDRTVYGKPLVYFDNAATTQKPRLVIDSIVDEYYSVNANVHRGVHYLSQQATELHESSRECPEYERNCFYPWYDREHKLTCFQLW